MKYSGIEWIGNIPKNWIIKNAKNGKGFEILLKKSGNFGKPRKLEKSMEGIIELCIPLSGSKLHSIWDFILFSIVSPNDMCSNPSFILCKDSVLSMLLLFKLAVYI